MSICCRFSRKPSWINRTTTWSMSSMASGIAREVPPKKSTGVDYHAGEDETANTMVSHPDLVHLDRAAGESGADQKRLKLPEELYTGIWWYARFPNHYSGDGSVARKELGEWNMKGWIDSIVECLRAVKADDASLKIQNEFYEKSKRPLDTRP